MRLRPKRLRTKRTRTATVAAVTAALTLLAGPAAWACGFLVADNGAVRLVRTATLAAYVDGVEHYVTSFEFQGGDGGFGSIVPLPDVPTTVEKAGSWTLQRLARETQPVPEQALFATRADAAAGEAEVLLETEIDALDITILRGGGVEVADWADQNGFDLGAGADEMLTFYAERSPIFMAARFDPTRAANLDQNAGDGTPIHLAIPTDAPWVPLRLLAFDKPGSEVVEADVYLLTPQRPRLLPAPHDGLSLEVSEPASAGLLDDLRSDENSAWVPDQAWLTYLRLNEEAADLTYDLAVSVDGEAPSPVDAGLVAVDGNGEVAVTGTDEGAGIQAWIAAVLLALAGSLLALGSWAASRTSDAGEHVPAGDR